MNWYNNILTSRKLVANDKESGTARSRRNDADLFARFLEGDDTALVELFDRHNHRLYLYCLQFSRSEQQAEDLTQEMWERMIRLRNNERTTVQNPVGLMLTIARNLCLDNIRRERRHTDLDELSEAHHPVSSIPELSHMEELVILALPHLPVAQREVLVLHAYSGYRFDEIAEMLGEPVGAVRTRAWRARAHLGRIISVMIGLDDDNKPTGDNDIPGEA